MFLCATRQSTGAEAEHAGVCARAGQIEAEHRAEAERRGRGPNCVCNRLEVALLCSRACRAVAPCEAPLPGGPAREGVLIMEAAVHGAVKRAPPSVIFHELWGDCIDSHHSTGSHGHRPIPSLIAC